MYDASGAVIGSASRASVRARGLWHAATFVLVRSSDGGSVYVHRRTAGKDIHPGMLDCWAGGVVGAGESPRRSAVRELAEELGVHGVPLRPLLRTVYEHDDVRFHAYLYEVFWDGPIVHQPEEVADGWWMTLPELRRRVRDPDWVPDGRQFIEQWFALADG